MLVVADLLERVAFVARHARPGVGSAPTAVVVHQCREARRGEDFGVIGDEVGHLTCQPVRHDYRRCWCGSIGCRKEQAAQYDTFGVEFNVLMLVHPAPQPQWFARAPLDAGDG